ncbi:neutral zinc metallopeptidase [Arthrobacter globiformis]|uniref:neutral zinc metallopeptidase n=1 Tax=Arthrobacter globiformis TaxID=1665 RepID=UPI0027D8323C|nr:neutral zinc metallopeptidase [Arthrobacter globiformis]
MSATAEEPTASPSYNAVAPSSTAPGPAPLSPAKTQPNALRSKLAYADAMAPTMSSFLAGVMTDVARYWTAVWQEAGYPVPYVNAIYPGPGEKMMDPCGNRMTTDQDVFYCGANDTIVISQVMATEIWNGRVKANTDPATGNPSGDFSVAFAVAHEYAHNLQTELGILPTAPASLTYAVYKTELHADCWAGVWANSALHEGILEAGDIEEGIQATMLMGDYAFNDPAHHGTPEQRSKAFMTGYKSGVPASCDPWLTESY